MAELNYRIRHEQLYEFIKEHTNDKFDEVCDAIYKLLLTSDISSLQRYLHNTNTHQRSH